jgi:hypothetical protein
MSVRAMTMLNEMGDTTFIWTEDQDEAWKEIIEKKMQEGVVFFIVEPRFKGLLPPKKTEVKRWQDAQKHRAIMIKDEDLMKMVESGAGSMVSTPDSAAKTRKRASSAAEAASSETIATRQRQGG